MTLLNLKMVFTLAVFGAWFYHITAHEGEDMCRTLEFTQPLRDHALIGHVFKNISMETEKNCRLNCYLENDCVSYNYGFSLISNEHICELSDSDHRQHPADLQPKHGFLYGATKNPCSKLPCSPNGKCQIGFTDEGYRCKCHAGFTGQTCDQLIWVKINTVPVCFGTRDDKHGTFTITQAGSIGALKLVHLRGIVICHSSSTRSFWGCEVSGYLDKTLMTIISHSNQRSLLLPRRSTTQMGVPDGECATNLTYKLDGFNDISPEIVFNTTSDPLRVSLNQEYWIWFAQDMVDCSETNNSGESCVDVYGWYIA